MNNKILQALHDWRSNVKFVFAVLLLMAAFSGPADAAIITYNFATGSGLNSITWPGPAAGTGNTAAINLGTTILYLDDPNTAGVVNAMTLTGSGTLFCVSGSPASVCAADATAEAPGAGHAAGIGVGNGRIEGAETLTIVTLPNYIARLISIQTTALYASQSPIEQWQYSINGGAPVVLNAQATAIDTYNFPSTPFYSLVISAPAGSNTFTLYSMTVDVQLVPEPASFVMFGGGLLALAALARRRRSAR